MVVIPTSTHVSMHYGYTGVDLGSYALTLLGLAGLIWFWRAKPITMPEMPGSWQDPSDRVDEDVDPRDPDWWLDPDDPLFGPPSPPGPDGEPAGTVPVAEFDPASVILGPVADVAPTEIAPDDRPPGPP
jgi:hypothetical protein